MGDHLRNRDLEPLREDAHQVALDVLRVIEVRIDLLLADELLLDVGDVMPGVGEIDAEMRGAKVEQLLGLGFARPCRAGRFGERRVACPDRFLGDVHDDTVGSAELEQAVPVDPDAGEDLGQQILVEGGVGDHRQPRVDLLGQVADRVVDRVRSVDRVVGDHRGQPHLQLLQVRQVGLHLGDEDVHPLCELGGELVWATVARPDEREAVPVEPVGGGPVLGVGAAPVANRHPVLVVTDAVVVAEVELVDLDLVAVADR